jgi:hypothetical protein
MSEPLSWQLLQQLKEKLERISVVNGYHTDAGANVRLEVTAIDEHADYPAIWLWEDEGEILGDGSSFTADEVQIFVECALKGDDTSAHQRAHRVRKDLRRALPRQAAGLISGVGRLAVTSARILPRAASDRGAPFIFVQVVLRASLAETVTPA